MSRRRWPSSRSPTGAVRTTRERTSGRDLDPPPAARCARARVAAGLLECRRDHGTRRRRLTAAHGPLLIVAYALAPGPGGAEALVNAALVGALSAAGEDFAVVAAPSPEPEPGRDHAPGRRDAGDAVHRVDAASAPGRALGLVAGWLDAPRHRPAGATARLVDRTRSLARLAPLRTVAWADAAAGEIARLQERPGGAEAVVWARATPPESFEAAIRAHRARPFPLVANYNDPMPPDRGGARTGPGSTDRALQHLQRRQNRYLARRGDAFTFPSAALRDLMIERAALDPRRCFVIPHLVPAHPASARPSPSDPPRLLYAGTLYRWVFEGPLAEVLPAWTDAGRLRLVVAAARADDHDIDALRGLIPGVEVHRDLDPGGLDDLVESVDALLVVDNRPPLLPTKVVDGVRRLRPLLAVARPGSTTTDVIHRAGGVTADRADAEAIDAALGELVTILADPVATAQRRRRQERAAERFSDTRVLADTRLVLHFAARHFEARTAGREPPAPPPLAPGP